jgi:hypothetical protein
MFLRVFPILLITAACACAGFAQEPEFRVRVDVTTLAPKDERWIELRSKNFLVVGNDSEERIRKVAADLELFRDQFASFFPRAKAVSSVPTTVVVFRNGETFRPYRRVRSEAQDGEDKDGYFQAGTDLNYLVLSDNAPNRSIIREYVRSLMPDSMGRVPHWFRLGLPEYFTTFQSHWDGQDRWIEIGTRDKEFNGRLKNQDLIPLESFFEMRPDGIAGGDGRDSTYYAEAWALTHYLLEDKRKSRLDRALKFFQSVADGQPTDDAFRDAFEMDIKEVEGRIDTGGGSGFRQYIRDARAFEPPSAPGGWLTSLAGYSLDPKKESLRSFFYTSEMCVGAVVGGVPLFYPCTKLITIPVNYDVIWAEVKQLPVRVLSEAETFFHRGSLMSHIGRGDDADELLQLSLRTDPKLAASAAALGFLRTRQGRPQEARQLLTQSLALDPRSYLTHYYAALLAETVPGQIETVATELRKTVELAPHFVEASEKLASVNARRGEDLEEALDLVRDAMKRSPGRESLPATLAQVLAANRVEKLPEDRLSVVQEFFTPEAEAVAETIALRAGAGKDEDIPEGVLVPLNPRALPTGETVRGRLTAIDCTQGLTLVVLADDRTVRLHSRMPDKVEFLRHTTTVATSISCGAVPRLPVSITYRPAPDGSSLGDPIRVEFLEETPTR